MVAELVGEVATHHDLGAEPLTGVGGPDIGEVAEPGVEQPAEEVEIHLVELDILPPVDLLGLAEGVGVRLVECSLVEVTDVAVDTKVEVAPCGVRDLETPGGSVAAEARSVGRLPPDGELAAAAVSHPDSVVVVAPVPAQETRSGARGLDQRHALRRVGRAVLAAFHLRLATYTRCRVLVGRSRRHRQHHGDSQPDCARYLHRGSSLPLSARPFQKDRSRAGRVQRHKRGHPGTSETDRVVNGRRSSSQGSRCGERRGPRPPPPPRGSPRRPEGDPSRGAATSGSTSAAWPVWPASRHRSDQHDSDAQFEWGVFL